MEDFKWLQMFAEGEGASAGAESTSEGSVASGETGTQDAQLDSLMSRIPERQKGAFKEAYEQTHKGEVETPKSEPKVHVPYSELIKSEEYKAEHKAYMDKTISDRFKAKDNEIAGLNQRNAQLTEALGKVAPKYGLDPTSEDFIDQMMQRLDTDESFIEDYAMAHDMSPEEAKKSLELQNRVQRAEAEQIRAQNEARNAQLARVLEMNVNKTKEQYPEFDFDTEWQSEEFRKEVYNHDMDTTAAYEFIHRNEIRKRDIENATKKSQVAIANSIASGQNRPIENGLSKAPAAVVRTTPNFDGMSSAQMLAFAQKNLVR